MTNDTHTPVDRRSGGAGLEIIGLGAVAVVAMGLLAFGYNTREAAPETAAGGGRYVDLGAAARPERPGVADGYSAGADDFDLGQGASSGEQKAPPQSSILRSRKPGRVSINVDTRFSRLYDAGMNPGIAF